MDSKKLILGVLIVIVLYIIYRYVFKDNTSADLVYTFTLTEILSDSFVNITSPITFTITSNGTAIVEKNVSVQPVRTKEAQESNPIRSIYDTSAAQAAAAGPGAE